MSDCYVPGVASEREAQLAALIDEWTAHMRWRKNYDRWREDRLWQEDTQSARLAAVREACGSLIGARVLDIGSGMGGFLVAAERNGAIPLGVEPNDAYCRITRLRGARYGLRAAVARGFGESLPVADHTCDIVLAQDILEHVRDPDQTLSEIRRVLKPGGVALATVINRFAWRDPHYHLYGINWLPRAWADALIVVLGRSKGGARFSDRQRLSVMYYDTFHGFVQRANRHGLSVIDTKEWALRRDPHSARGRFAAFVRLLDRIRLVLPVYRAYRRLIVATFEVSVRPTGPAS